MSAAVNKFGAVIGFPGAPPAPAAAPAASNGAVTGHATGKWSLENPMMWLLAVAAVTLGLVAVSTTVRLGPFEVSASADEHHNS